MDAMLEIKMTIVGDAPEEQKEGRVLNKIIRITENGWDNTRT